MTRTVHAASVNSPVHGASPVPDGVAAALAICRTSPVPAFAVTGPERSVMESPALESLRLSRGGHGVPAAALAGAVEELFGDGVTADDAMIISVPLGNPAVPVSMTAVPVVAGGKVQAVFASGAPPAGDDAVRVEVERATAAKSRFLASASHDLRQPFQAMRLFLEALTVQLDGQQRALQTAGLLGNALQAGEKLLTALLDISTLDAGTVKVAPKTFALDDMILRLADEIRPQAAEKGLSIKVRIQAATADTDPVLLERIIRNLLSNAVRYTRQGAILLAVRPRGGALRVEVWDTGFGIPPEQLDSIFDEFHQLENPSRDPDKGLGLGLAIVRRLSHLLHTPLTVRSTVGRGSLFAVTVPRAAEEEVAAEDNPDSAGALPLHGTTVLVVDDDAMVLTGLRLSLESWGCTVVFAGDMREVMQAVDGLTEPPDIILSDLRLPGGVTGFQVIDRVRRLFATTIPAVVLTGETGEAELVEGRRRGCAFLHKPLHPADLRQVLGRIRSGEAS
ncbi:signal transduction histidine kinase/ActR/RegA family two-component response regulator [Azospirillum fermentarium]|uniref:ATP-binding response regulator n=1 Tax=Azospirillum fermentarium TaxID=1233114 RepID=UPI002225CE7F|nr:hybrid sensor histidine kinase/response regulator [Azospirillum fermentarium]MCW2246662.1 signal transduction histidine kinase/ActR/RegA family two-component response regulator [Azospirillum fermentarium]